MKILLNTHIQNMFTHSTLNHFLFRMPFTFSNCKLLLVHVILHRKHNFGIHYFTYLCFKSHFTNIHTFCCMKHVIWLHKWKMKYFIKHSKLNHIQYNNATANTSSIHFSFSFSIFSKFVTITIIYDSHYYLSEANFSFSDMRFNHWSNLFV